MDKDEVAKIKDAKLSYISKYITDVVRLKNLRPYQINIYRQFTGEIKSGILSMDMGTGKSLTAVNISIKDDATTLIICPKTLINTWVGEIQKFYKDTVAYAVYHNDYISNSKEIKVSAYKFIITTYDKVSSEYVNIKNNNITVSTKGFNPTILPDLYNFKDVPKGHKIVDVAKIINKGNLIFGTKWNYVVIDEAHNIRNIKTLKFISCFSIKANNYLALTGTTIINDIKDKIALNKFACGKYIIDNINDFMIEASINRKDVPELAHLEAKIENVYVQLNERQKIYYNKEICTLKSNLNLKETGKALSCITRLRQICISMYILQSKEKYKDEFIESPKIYAVLELINKILEKGEKVIIFSNFNDNLIKLHELIGGILLIGDSSSEYRSKINKMFEIESVMFSNFAVGGVGLNLIEANNVILLEPWWNTPLEDQAISRVLRPGQTRKVNVYNIIAEKSIEFYMLNIKAGKMDLYTNKGHQESILATIRNLISGHGGYDLLIH